MCKLVKTIALRDGNSRAKPQKRRWITLKFRWIFRKFRAGLAKYSPLPGLNIDSTPTDLVRSGLGAKGCGRVGDLVWALPGGQEMAALQLSSPATGNSFDEMLARLIQTADADKIPEIVAPLTAAQRSRLAVFCYSRAHLNGIGLAIAATCDLHSLMQAAPSNAAGNVIFMQSREPPKTNRRPPGGGRARITLARSASGNSGLATIIANVACDEAPDCVPA
jgi:hypothetical protein